MPHHVVVYQINSLEDYLPDLMDLEVKVVVNLMVVDKIQGVGPKEEEVEVHHQEINLQEKVHLLKEEVEEEIDLRCVNEEGGAGAGGENDGNNQGDGKPVEEVKPLEKSANRWVPKSRMQAKKRN